MARVLSYEDYGSYGQVLLITSFAGALLSFGLSQIIYVYLSQKEEKGEVLTSNVLAAVILGTIGTGIVYLSSDFFANWLNNESIEQLLKLFSISLLLSIPNLSINSFLIFNDRVKESVAITICTNVLKVLLVVSVIQLYNSVSLALLAIVISYLVQFVVSLIRVRKDLSKNFSKSLLWEQVKKGFPLGLTGILGTGILYIDGIMVSKLEGVNAYAIYRNGAIEVPYIATIYSSIAAIILPEVAKHFSQNQFKEILQLKKKVIMNTMMLTYPVLIFLLFNASELIVVYLGAKYEASAIIFAVFNLTLLIRINDYSDILIAANKSKYILYYYAVCFSVNILLNYFLIQELGIVGAAISTVASIGLLAFLQLRKSLALIRSNVLGLIDLKKFFHLITVSLILGFLLDFMISSYLETTARLIVFSFLYFPIIYLYLLKFKFFSVELISKFLPQKIIDKL